MSTPSIGHTLKSLLASTDSEVRPDVPTDYHTRLRRQVLVTCSIICGVIAFVFAAEMYYLHGFGQKVGNVMLGATVLALLNPWLVRWTDSTRLAGIIITVEMVGAMVLVAMNGGGIQSAALTVLPFASLFSTFIVGARWGAVTTVSSVLIIHGFFWLHRLGVRFPRTWNEEEGYLLLTLALTASVVMVGLLGWVYERRSIRSLRRVNAELERARDELELRVAERTAALAAANAELQNEVDVRRRYEAELIDAKSRAEEAAKAKSRFLATMSHEIRTPMNGVIGMTDLLGGTTLTDEQQELTETIRTSGDALLTIIDDILDFSKIESGHLELEARPFEVLRCAEEALDVVAGCAAEQGLDLVLDVAPDVPESATGDITRLRQVLINLLSNAIKFTESGSVTLRVERAAPAAPTALAFAVEDTGIGIAPDRIDRLFDSFSQADSSTTRKYGGTGLGLAICRQLVELMGGEIAADSALGQGSTFRFTIAVPLSSAPPSFMRADQEPLRGRTVALFSETTATRGAIASLLRHWGCDALEVDPSRVDPACVAAADAVLIDEFGLSEEAGERVRAWCGPDRVLTVRAQRGSGHAPSAVHHLTRPVRPKRLNEHLLGVLGHAAPEAEPEVRERAGAGVPTVPADELPLRVLVAEDNVVNQKVIDRVLRRLGCAFDVVGNGREALDALRHADYDVVLMDVQMPVMDGLEATRRIRAAGIGHEPRIVAMTANAMAGDRERCLEAGMDDYVSKPVRMEDLHRVLQGSDRLPVEVGA